jgi:hypothetical protein
MSLKNPSTTRRNDEEIRAEIKNMRAKIRKDSHDPEVSDGDILYLSGFVMALKWSLGEENR